MKTKSLFALLPFLSALAAFPAPAAAQEMECEMCRACPMCQERMEKTKDMEDTRPLDRMDRRERLEKLKDLRDMEPEERRERMEKLKDLPDLRPMERRERMKEREEMRPMERMERMEKMKDMPPVEHMKQMRQLMERLERRLPASSGEASDAKALLAKVELAAVLQQYQKVRSMEEETQTELELLKEPTPETAKRHNDLTGRLTALRARAEELRKKVEACCAMDAGEDGKPQKKGPAETRGDSGKHDHDHAEKPESAAAPSTGEPGA